MHDIASANDEIAGIARGPEFFSDSVVFFRRSPGIHRQRRYRNVGIGEKMDERRPYAVVEAAFDGFPYSLSENFVEISDYRRVPRRAVGDF